MRVLIQETLRPRSVTDYPTVVLRKDNWDDYGFKTMFYVRLHLGTDRVVDLETVKILTVSRMAGLRPFRERLSTAASYMTNIARSVSRTPTTSYFTA